MVSGRNIVLKDRGTTNKNTAPERRISGAVLKIYGNPDFSLKAPGGVSWLR